jgi:CzcA family heavy metal efflux pump
MGHLLDRLIAWSIHRRVVLLLAAAGAVVGGLAITRQAEFDALPDFTPPLVIVQTEAAGLGTNDVERLITQPIERALLGTPGLVNLRSLSGPGLSVATLVFAEGLDIYRVRQLVTERLDLAAAHLPAVAGRPRLTPVTTPVGALLKVCLTSSSQAPQGLRDLRTFAEWRLRPRLLAIPGVSQVIIHSAGIERLEVRPDPRRMRERGVTLVAIEDAVRSAQGTPAAGFVEAGAARLEAETAVRLQADTAAEVIGGLMLGVRGGVPVRIADVADVVLGEEPPVGAALFDGRPAVYVEVMKLTGADTLAVTRAIEGALHELAPAMPAGGRFEPPVFRQASFIETSLRSVSRAMVIGALLVVVILFAFLRAGRLAAISLTAIPLSLLAAAAVLVIRGVSINGMTLGGLAIAGGEVVDDAIVDVENVWRRLRENARAAAPRPALEVVREASREIRGSVVYATLIVAVVLLPVLLLGGVAGRIFSPLAQAYVLAIVASLAVALTVTPALCAWLLPRLATKEATLPRLSRVLLGRYRRLLTWVVDRPRLVLVAAGGAAACALVAVPFLGGRFLPEFRESAVIAHLNAMPGTSLDEALRLATRVDAQLRPGVAVHVASRAGRAELGEDPFPVNRVETDVVLYPEDSRDADQLATDVGERMARVPGMSTTVEDFLGERLHEILAGETAPLVVKVSGPDLATLRSTAAAVGRAMSSTPGLAEVRVEPQIDVPQIRLIPDPAALARHGLLPVTLADAVFTWRFGRTLNEILEPDGRIIPVVLAGRPEWRRREALPDLPVDTAAGTSVPLSSVARVEVGPAPTLVNHEQGERRIAVLARASGSALSGAVSHLEDELRRTITLPPGYHIEVAGEATARREAALRMAFVGALVLVAILVLLATAFSSFRDAVIVLLNLPLGLVGGVLGALLLSEGLSVAALVGFVTLFGIIARNGIMLVAHKQHLDAQLPQVGARDRVLQAAEERLLPVLMTAATAGLALLPLALSYGSRGSELESPMAIIICGGLLTSTALNMLVLPTVYVWLDARRRRAQERA